MSGLPVWNFVTRDVEDPAGSGSIYSLEVKGVFYTSLKGVLNLFFKEEGFWRSQRRDSMWEGK